MVRYMMYKELSAINFFLILLPSGMAYACAGSALLGVHLNVRQVMIIGTLVALSTLSIRLVGIPTGLHTLLISLALVLFFVFIARISLRTAVLAALISTAVIFIGNNLFIMPTLSLLGITVAQSVEIMKYHIIMAWVSEIIPATIVTVMARFFDLVLLEAPEASRLKADSR